MSEITEGYLEHQIEILGEQCKQLKGQNKMQAKSLMELQAHKDRYKAERDAALAQEEEYRLLLVSAEEVNEQYENDIDRLWGVEAQLAAAEEVIDEAFASVAATSVHRRGLDFDALAYRIKYPEGDRMTDWTESLMNHPANEEPPTADDVIATLRAQLAEEKAAYETLLVECDGFQNKLAAALANAANTAYGRTAMDKDNYGKGQAERDAALRQGRAMESDLRALLDAALARAEKAERGHDACDELSEAEMQKVEAQLDAAEEVMEDGDLFESRYAVYRAKYPKESE